VPPTSYSPPAVRKILRAGQGRRQANGIPAFPALYEPADEVEWRARVDAELADRWHSSDRHESLEVIMNDACSLSISAGIIAFGIWIAAGTIGAGAHLARKPIGLLAVIVGTISL
jgi:hypothetical protein